MLRYNTAFKLTSRNYASKSDIHKIIRVDHAGELGADRIYAGQMAVLGKTEKGPLIQHMWEQEKRHRETFEELIRKHRVRPTIMTPIWNVAGFALGAGSAILGMNIYKYKFNLEFVFVLFLNIFFSLLVF